MAGQLLLINPRGRRKRNARRRPHHGFKLMHRRRNPHRTRRRRHNIMSPLLMTNPVRRHRRRRNPLHLRHHSRRRRNPIAMGGLMAMIKDAAIASAGGVALDYVFGYVNNMVPATMKRTPGTIGIGDAVKVLFNVMVGTMLNRPTRGLARKAAEGSMTVHFYQLISGSLPTTIQAGLASAGSLGWYQPAPVTRGTQWITPNRGRVQRGSPLLSIFSRGSPALSSVPTVASPFAVPTVASVPAGVPIR